MQGRGAARLHLRRVVAVEAARVPVVGDAETLDFEQLIGLRPTVVVVAVDVVQRVRIDRIKALGIPVYQVHVTRLAQMPESLRRLGSLAGTEAVAGTGTGLSGGRSSQPPSSSSSRSDPNAIETVDVWNGMVRLLVREGNVCR